MKRFIVLTAATLALASGNLHAAVGVTIGHHTIASDGFPNIGPGEQASVFVCKGKMSGPKAMDCSLDKCKAKYGIPKSETRDSVVKKHCSADGWSERRGYSIVMVGPKGDNQFIMSKALGDPTREVAMSYVKSNNFPVNKGTIVLDYYDDDAPEVHYRGKATDEEFAHGTIQRDI